MGVLTHSVHCGFSQESHESQRIRLGFDLTVLHPVTALVRRRSVRRHNRMSWHWKVPHVKRLSSLKRLPCFLLLFESLCGKPFISYRRKKPLLLSHWSESGPSFPVSSLLTGKSVSCWRWKDCGLFSRENRTTSPSLLPLPSALHNHT